MGAVLAVFITGFFIGMVSQAWHQVNEDEKKRQKIKNVEQLNAYKLMEGPYMAKLLEEKRYDEFMKHLKQSEEEMADRICDIIREINKRGNL